MYKVLSGTQIHCILITNPVKLSEQESLFSHYREGNSNGAMTCPVSLRLFLAGPSFLLRVKRWDRAQPKLVEGLSVAVMLPECLLGAECCWRGWVQTWIGFSPLENADNQINAHAMRHTCSLWHPWVLELEKHFVQPIHLSNVKHTKLDFTMFDLCGS